MPKSRARSSSARSRGAATPVPRAAGSTYMRLTSPEPGPRRRSPPQPMAVPPASRATRNTATVPAARLAPGTGSSGRARAGLVVVGAVAGVQFGARGRAQADGLRVVPRDGRDLDGGGHGTPFR